jgi:hypothetical protein
MRRPPAVAAAVAVVVVAAAGAPHGAAAQALSSFGPPHPSSAVLNATVGTSPATDPEACAAACLATPSCIAFTLNASAALPVAPCTLSGWAPTWAVVVDDVSSYYFKLLPRNDTRVVPALAFALDTPTSGVSLDPSSVLGRVFALNRVYLAQFAGLIDDLLFWFRVRAGVPDPPGQSLGWDDANFEGGYGLRGSVAGAFLMGAGGHVRWANDSALWAALVAVVDGIAAAQGGDGFAMAFNRTDLHCRENPDYVTSWVTHGLLEAAAGGYPRALTILRAHYDWFDVAGDELAQYLPPGGGPNVTGLPWPGGVPVDPYSPPYCRRDLQTNQGMVHNTRMALSPVGTWADARVVADLYEEEWWLAALAARDPNAIWMRHYYPHNYEVTALEAFADMGVITGDPKYLAAVDGAWDLLRASWIHVGGSFAINENQLYPPGSYFLEPPGPDWQHPTPTPTGELCGSSFWIKLNQRLLRLRPGVEAYAAEIERSLFNVVAAAISADGTGIRYFARLHGRKDAATNVSTCCEGQGTRELGALPEYVFSTAAAGVAPAGDPVVHVHLHTAATLNTTAPGGAGLTVSITTAFPYGADVALTVAGAGPAPATGATLLLRIPGWIASDTLAVQLSNGTTVVGERGTYLPVRLATLPLALALTLPMNFTVTRYTGATTIGAGARYVVEYGPILLGATGPFTPIGNASCIVLPSSIDPARPSDWLVPVAGAPLHWTVAGAPGVEYVPYFEIQDENFTAYPIFGSY